MKGRLSTLFRRRYVSERHEHGRARYLSAKTDPEGSKELPSGATEKALVVGPILPPRSLNNTGHSTAILPESGSSFERNLSTAAAALMERIPTRWLYPEWHVPCKSYRVVIQGHFVWVRSVAFDPSNEWFCTGSADRTTIKVINGHLGLVRSVAFDPSNAWYCTGSADRTIKIWDVASGVLNTLTLGKYEAFAVSNRHTYMFSSGDDKQVKCWDLEQNKVIRSYHGHLHGVYCLALHPTVDVLLTRGRDSVCRVWDIRTKMKIFALLGHDNDVCSVVSRATDPQVITGSHDSTIKFWDLRYGRTMTTLTHHKKAVREMALHLKENAFVSASADNTKKFRLSKGEFFHNMLSQQRATINAVAVNEDGVMVTGDSLTQSLLLLEEIKSFGKVREAVRNQGTGSLLGMVKAGMTDEAVWLYENMEERCRKLKENSLSFDEKIIDSVVKVFSATTRHDSYRPWQNLDAQEFSGSGFAISGKRILTCAHVVRILNPCTFIDVQRNNSTTVYKARVTKIAHECDLAILEVDNNEFWEGLSALSFADIPLVGEALTVVGFPEGQESHVCESGLVTGIKFRLYSHSQTEHLAIIVDANIISGHSGGPAITEGKVIGVAFQSVDFSVLKAYIGSVIPTCVVMQFLSSSEESQQLSSFSSLGLTFEVTNFSRSALKMTGVEIKKISSLSGAHKIMCPLDMMLAIDNIAIGNDGTVPFRGEERIDFRYLVSSKKLGESLLIKFLRSGEVHECDVTLKPLTPHIQVQKYYNRPTYFLFGGLVFVPFSKAYIDDIGFQLSPDDPLLTIETEAEELEAGELVMLSRVLRHDTNRYYEHLEHHQVNGVNVHSLKHLVELIEHCCREYLTLEFQGGKVAILHYASAKEATSEIMELYRVFC